MSVGFEIKKSINLLLFVLQSLGGKASPDRIFVLFYFADLKFLSDHGRLAFGTFYLALKSGPAPFNILRLLIEVSNKGEDNIAVRIKHYIDINEAGEIVSNSRYEWDSLSAEEVECIFMVIQKYKHTDLEILKTTAMGIAWQMADRNSVISVLKMAEEGNATTAIIAALEARYRFIADHK